MWEADQNNIHSGGALPRARRAFSLVGLGIFGILALSYLLDYPAQALADGLWPGWQEHPWGLWLVNYVPFYGIAVPAGLWILKKLPVSPPEKMLGFPGKLLALFACISCFLMYAGNLLGIGVTGLLRLIPGVTASDPVSAIVSTAAFLPRLLVVVLLAPILEDYIFRKILIDRLGIYGEKTAVILSALLFGLFHGNLSQFFYAFFLGLCFGYFYLRTGQLRLTVLLHMAINFMGGILAPAFLKKLPFLLEKNPDPEALIQGLTQALPWVILLILYAFGILVIALLGLVLLCVNRKRIIFRPALRELPRGTVGKTALLNPGMLLALAGCLALMIRSLFR